MKKVLFIAAIFALASCSNETSTSSKDSVCTDSTCTDSMSVDSLAHQVELRSDSVLTGIKELNKYTKVGYISLLGHDPRYPIMDNWFGLVDELIDYIFF